jgi:hypothetical protein
MEEYLEEARTISEEVNCRSVDHETIGKIQARVLEMAGRVPDIQDAIFLRYLAHDVLSRLPGSRQGSDGVN